MVTSREEMINRGCRRNVKEHARGLNKVFNANVVFGMFIGGGG